MRLQLLAAAMEREHELDADVVSVLHVAPKRNRELMYRVTSPVLRSKGSNIHTVWENLVSRLRFSGAHVEDVHAFLISTARDREWADYMRVRYAGCHVPPTA